MRSWLVRRGHVVFTAGTSEEAQAVLGANTVDGVFVDIWLGQESGFDLFEWIDMHHHRIAQNTVFVTGDVVRDPEVDRIISVFARPVLTKPFELTELERMIRSWSTT